MEVVYEVMSTIMMYKEIFPFNLIDLDDSNTCLPEFPTSKNKKSVVFYNNEPMELVSKTKILLVPFCDSSLFTPDIQSIETEMLKFAKKHKIKAEDNNCLHILKTVKHYVFHGFVII